MPRCNKVIKIAPLLRYIIIKELYKRGYTQQDIGKKLNLSQVAISKYLKKELKDKEKEVANGIISNYMHDIEEMINNNKIDINSLIEKLS